MSDDKTAVVFAYHEMGASCLEAMLAAGWRVALLVTHHDDESEERWFRVPAQLAKEHGIPIAYGEDMDEGQIEAALRKADACFIFSFHYRFLLGEGILSAAPKGAYNLHPSLLPQYRGRAPLNWVLVNGERSTGVTLHKMVKRADAGEIAAQSRVDIEFSDTALSLYRKLIAAARSMLAETLPLIAEGKVRYWPQDISKGSYYGRRGPEDGKFDWSFTAERIYNLVRAVSRPWPGAYCKLSDGRSLFVWLALPVSAKKQQPGEWEIDAYGHACVKCGDVALRLFEVSLDGENSSGRDIPDFLTKHRVERLT